MIKNKKLTLLDKMKKIASVDTLKMVTSKPIAKDIICYCDGACRGNGYNARGSYGSVIKYPNGSIVKISENLGLNIDIVGNDPNNPNFRSDSGSGLTVKITNNITEYISLIRTLERISMEPVLHNIIVYMDSKLVAEQVSGSWKINSPILKILNGRVKNIIKKIGTKVLVKHVLRLNNKEADKLANEAFNLNVTKFVLIK
jgi:ribonuclease HI